MNLSHILVIDDDNEIRYLISEFLIQNGYFVNSAADIKEAELLLAEFKFDVIILDILMPGETGISFLERVKQHIVTPVIMLTALGDVDDRINGLESGAEDYLSKPFEPRELLLRIQKIINRTANHNKNADIIIFGDFSFNMRNNTLKHHGQLLHLTTGESKLLKIFAENIGTIITRDKIVQNLNEVNTRTIDAQIARLRSKIEQNPKTPQYLQTIRNEGYILWSSS